MLPKDSQILQFTATLILRCNAALERNLPVPILKSEMNLFPENLLSESTVQEWANSWRVVYTRSRQEKSLARYLVQNEIPFYLPLIPKENKTGGRHVRSMIPLFANYVFLYCTDHQRINALKSNRITQFLEVVDQQQLQNDLHQIHQLVDADVPLSIESKISPGQSVRVKNGAFAGFEGIVTERLKKSRLFISVKYLQQGVSLEIDDFMLEII